MIKALEFYIVTYGQPHTFLINKDFYIAAMKQGRSTNSISFIERKNLLKLRLNNASTDYSNLNPPEYLIGVHSDGYIRKVKFDAE